MTRWILGTLAAVVLAAAFARAEDEPRPGAIEVVHRLGIGPGNLSVCPDGRIVFSVHPFFGHGHRVLEIPRERGLLIPFPNAAWNDERAEGYRLDAVLGIQCDEKGVVWMLDNGLRGGVTPKLVAWKGDTETGSLYRIIHLPAPATVSDSFVNDLAITRSQQRIYVADPAGGKDAALIVVDAVTGNARRVLEGHASVVPEDVDLVIDGAPVEMVTPSGTHVRPRVGVNPIALDAQDAWLYFGPMSSTSLYRVRTHDLADASLSKEELAKRVERYASKPICDGISIDVAGNVYVTDVANHAIGVIPADTRTYRILARDPERLPWPDALSFGPDGKLYTVANQLHKTARLNGGHDETKPPFNVVRIEPLAKGIPGR